MSVRYIGSKARVIDAIAPLLGAPGRSRGVFVDAFCGTGVVAETAARLGWPVRLNDHLASAVAMSHARLVDADTARFKVLGGYRAVVEELNSVRPVRGFIWKHYTPASKRYGPVARMYFTERNAARIDAMRAQIRRWRDAKQLSVAEERLLIADLLMATNRVANIAGTYGCFLSYWTSQAKEDVVLRARKLFPTRVSVASSVLDVRDVLVGERDVLYLDPPYTKRQYAAYYHILETICCGDRPEVGGITGLRPWQDKASDFCYRTRALSAIVGLVQRHPARRVLLSYSNEGHVELKPLAEALSTLGRLSIAPLGEIGRYRPNRAASDASASVTEYLLELRPLQSRVQEAALA